MRRTVRILAIVALLAGSVGCIERRLVLRSDPPGASAFVDGILVGPTPVSVDFEHYGHHTIVLRKQGFQTLRQAIHVHGPWYLSFPFDLFTEHFWIGGHVDLHEHEFALVAHDAKSDIEAFIQEAAAIGVELGDVESDTGNSDSGNSESGPKAESAPGDSDPDR